MKIALAAVLAAGALAAAPSALADDSAPDLRVGQAGTLVNGDVVQTWTISGLRKSGDVIPREIAGTLWEATATNTAVAGSVIPIIPNFNARAGVDNYRVLFGVATAQGINPATLAQGEKSSGKLYFDVTGPNPDRVVFNDGEADLLVWINAPEPVAGPPSVQSATPQPTKPAGSPTTAKPAQTPATPAASAPATSDTPAATSQGTPAATSQGTPAAAGTPATSPAAPAASAPATSDTPAATSQGTPAATSQGTPAAGDTPAAPTASPGATSAGTPAAAPAGTPAPQSSPAAPTTVSPSPTPAATSAGTPAG